MLWSMLKAALTLACLAPLGHARQVQTSRQNEYLHSTLQSHGSKAFKQMLLSLEPASAFNPSGAGLVNIPFKNSMHAGTKATPQMAASAALPTLRVLAGVCTVPTCLGFCPNVAWASATATMGGLVLRAASTPETALHAGALLTYGLCRLNSREMIRTLSALPTWRPSKILAHWRHRPIVPWFTVLYACLAFPAILTTKMGFSGPAFTKLLVLMWTGILMDRAAHLFKNWNKSRHPRGTIVKSGPYSLFRHPDLTGGQILWTANMICGFMAVASRGPLSAEAFALVCSVVGWAGCFYILAKATANAEYLLQSSRVDEEYHAWRRRTFGGFYIDFRRMLRKSHRV